MNVRTFLKTSNFPRCQFLPEINIISFKELLKAPRLERSEVKRQPRTPGAKHPHQSVQSCCNLPGSIQDPRILIEMQTASPHSRPTETPTGRAWKGPFGISAVQHRLGLGAMGGRALYPSPPIEVRVQAYSKDFKELLQGG